MLQAMQQQFECMGVMFNEIQDMMDRQDAVIATWHEGHPQRIRNDGWQERHVPIDESDDNHKDEFDNEEDRASMNSGSKFGPRREICGKCFQRDPIWKNGVDRNLGSIKVKIPLFQGKNDPEAYLEWEKKVELTFECHNYSEEKKVKLVVIEFTDYAII